MSNTQDAHYLTQAVALATQNVRNGGGPFGAIIVLPNGEIIEGTNQVTNTNDPTAHAEVTAIRKATAHTKNFSLAGAVLYSSCEPCPMCLGAALWARVDRIVFAADRHDAAWGGFDDAEFYRILETGSPAQCVTIDNAREPFETWRNNTARTDY